MYVWTNNLCSNYPPHHLPPLLPTSPSSPPPHKLMPNFFSVMSQIDTVKYQIMSIVEILIIQ